MALIVVDAIVISWRDDFVRPCRRPPRSMPVDLPVNLRGLTSRFATTTEQHEGVPILVVGGKIVNITEDRDVPHLRFAVRNAAQQEIYSWTAAPPLACCRRAAVTFPHPARFAAAGRPDVWCVSSTATMYWPEPLIMARILIAEDEEALCAMCARALAGAGHEVKTACDGSDALDLLKREDGHFDLLLTDIRMPIMDGIALSLAAARTIPM